MITITKENFDIEQICHSGQCFRMEKVEENTYSVIAYGKYIEVTQEKGSNEITFSCDEEEFETIWKEYFDLDSDYSAYIAAIPKEDMYLTNAAKFGAGIRILRQEPWEMVISFIISQQNNIKRIRKCVETICQKYGQKKINFKGEVYYDFPTVEQLSLATEEELRACNLGYRSKYLVKTSESILRKEVDLTALLSLTFEEAKKELLKLTGVGVKVADCICLFGLHHMDGFPIDTHIKQVLEAEYKDGFPFERYKGFAGVIQQYIFYYDLLVSKE